MNCELPDVRAGFRKGRGARDKIANIHWIIRKAREFQKKTSTTVLLTTPNRMNRFGKELKKISKWIYSVESLKCRFWSPRKRTFLELEI